MDRKLSLYAARAPKATELIITLYLLLHYLRVVELNEASNRRRADTVPPVVWMATIAAGLQYAACRQQCLTRHLRLVRSDPNWRYDLDKGPSPRGNWAPGLDPGAEPLAGAWCLWVANPGAVAARAGKQHVCRESPAGQHMPFSRPPAWPHRLMATAVSGRCPTAG